MAVIFKVGVTKNKPNNTKTTASRIVLNVGVQSRDTWSSSPPIQVPASGLPNGSTYSAQPKWKFNGFGFPVLFNGFPRIPTNFHDFPHIFHGFPRIFSDFSRILSRSQRFSHRYSLITLLKMLGEKNNMPLYTKYIINRVTNEAVIESSDRGLYVRTQLA